MEVALRKIVCWMCHCVTCLCDCRIINAHRERDIFQAPKPRLSKTQQPSNLAHDVGHNHLPVPPVSPSWALLCDASSKWWVPNGSWLTTASVLHTRYKSHSIITHQFIRNVEDSVPHSGLNGFNRSTESVHSDNTPVSLRLWMLPLCGVW